MQTQEEHANFTHKGPTRHQTEPSCDDVRVLTAALPVALFKM